MGRIDQEEAAKRLARVILSDIEIYHAKKIRSPADLKPELDEGYALFRSRVEPALVPIFKEMVADKFGTTRPAAKPPAPVAAPPPPPVAAPPPPAMAAPSPPKVAAPPPPPPAAVAAPPPPPVAAPRREVPDTREAAHRLAAVMIARIQVSDRDDCGVGLAREIEEARVQFASFVLPELVPLFDLAVADAGLLEASAPTTPELEAPDDPTDRVPAPDLLPEESSGGGFEEMPTVARPELRAREPEPVSVAPEPLPAVPEPPPWPSVAAPPPIAPAPPPAWALSRGRLVAAALLIAGASAGIVYYLLTS